MNGASAYLLIRNSHLLFVALSGALFVLRGLGVLTGAHWPMCKGARIASVGIDTLLLASGLTLWTALQLNPWRDVWLGVKLLLVIAYIVLGSLALKRAPTTAQRTWFFIAAVIVFATIAGIAVTHDPLGFWRVS